MFTSMSIFGLFVLVIDIVAIVGLLMGRSSHGHKILWVFLIFFMPCLGVLLYYLFGRRVTDA